MKTERLTNYLTGGIMLIAVVAIIFFAFFSDGSSKSEAKTFADVYSVNDSSEAYQTLTMPEVKSLLTDKKTQMLLVTCRFCPHCQNYEPVVQKFIKDSLGGDRNKIVRWEAGYKCYPKTDDPDSALYGQLSSQIIGEEGVPQTIFIKDGKVADKQVGALSADELREFLNKNGYNIK